jgi:hypothetical protein
MTEGLRREDEEQIEHMRGLHGDEVAEGYRAQLLEENRREALRQKMASANQAPGETKGRQSTAGSGCAVSVGVLLVVLLVSTLALRYPQSSFRSSLHQRMY